MAVEETSRLSWDVLWMQVADTVAKRSHCTRRQAGCVIVTNNNRIVATGYNGPPAGYNAQYHGLCVAYCERANKKPEDLTPSYFDCVSVHAEANAVMFCDRRDREGGTLYVNTPVCWDCAKLIANSGIAQVTMKIDDATHREFARSMEFMRNSGIRVRVTRDDI